ncbi:MAG: ABC transporter substrate-binding protein, partial [Candidatus Methanoperedens sp.]|nr:ABC transporter substrate-binding protein [Candidatus Methanoperedens sp.]
TSDNIAVNLLWPVLFAHDPQTGLITSGNAVVPEPPALPEVEQAYSVSGDLLWSDGTPITAYDVVYSLLSSEARAAELTGLRINDEQHFTLAYSSADCDTQSRTNSWVIATESHNPDFRPFADWFMAQEDALPNTAEWHEAFAEWSENADWMQFPDEYLSGGPFTVVWDDARGIEYVRQNEIILTTLQSDDRPDVEQFLHGDVNLLLDPPFERRADLRSTPGIQLYEAPGYSVDYIVFNQSDPNYPRDAFVEGEPLEQLPHRYFSDVRVRRAMQLAIDVPALIDGALYGNATPINGAYSPASWAYDPDLPMPEYDPDAAKRLLDEAGWRDINGDGYRECFGCLNASPETPLSIYLGAQSDGIRDR